MGKLNKKSGLKEALIALLELEGGFGMNFTLATEEYPSLEGVSDKEIAFCIDKYISFKELDTHPHIQDFFDPYQDEEDEDDFNF